VATVEYALSLSMTGVADSSRVIGVEYEIVSGVHIVGEGVIGLVSLLHLCSCRFGKCNAIA
jgi:hypothetical protein